MDYKFSNYNYFKEINNNLVGINLITRRPFILNDKNKELFNKYKNNLRILKSTNEHLFSVLVKLGVIIRRREFEAENLKTVHNQTICSDSTYRMTINPTLDCNFSCWYCYESHPKGRISEEVTKNIIKFVNKLFTNGNLKVFHLDWFGGEPLLEFKDIIYPIASKIKGLAELNGINFKGIITTNGYLIDQAMIPLMNEISLSNFQITLDGTPGKHNKIRKHKGKYSSYSKIVENINLICENIINAKVELRINYTDEILTDIHEIIRDFPRKNRDKIEVTFQKVWQYKKNENEEIGALELLKDKFISEGFNWGGKYMNDKPYTCYADLSQQAVINYDGRVFKCTARDFHKSNADGYLSNEGTINWRDNTQESRLNITGPNISFCYDCSLLPACFGPCSQKIVELDDNVNFPKICNREGIKSGIDILLTRFCEENT